MKFRYLFNDYMPAQKCGAEVGLGVAALASEVAGGIFSADQQSNNVNMQLAAQARENQLNRDFNSQQAEYARNFQERMQGEQNQFVAGLQDKQQQYNLQSMAQQAVYNSPTYQREQLQKAGLNPAVYFSNKGSFSGSSAVAGGSPSAPSVGAPSGASSSMGLSPVSYQPKQLQLGVLTSQLAQNMKNMAEARKIEKETGWIDESTRANIRALNAQSDLHDVMKAGQDIMNQLNKAKVPYAYKQAAADLYKACSEIELNKANKITSESQAKVNAALEKLHNAQTNLSAKELEKLGIEVQMYPQYLKSVINKNAAEASEASESAKGLRIENYIKDFIKNKNIDKAVSDIDSQMLLNDTKREQLRQELKRLQKVSESYDNNPSHVVVDAVLKHVLGEILGLRLSANVSE